jgi:N-acyl-D-amino-acid deacylase
MHDLVIRGGLVVDGTGAPPRVADVAIDADRVVAVGVVTEPARRVIDADGLVVTPGWVDVHTHYDGQVTWDPEVSPSGWHGVTTVVMGNCGVGFAPVRPDERDWLIQLMEGVEDIPGTALAEGMSWKWESFPEYLDEVERMPRVMDVAAMLAHGALRAYVLGGARSNDQASDEEISLMAKLAREAIEAGAVGVSTTRTIGHRAKSGEPAAGTFAAPVELLALGEALADAGRRVLSVVSDHLVPPKGESGYDWTGTDAEFDWMAELSRSNRVPVTYMLLDASFAPDAWRHVFAESLARNRDGAWLVPQVAGKPASVMAGWESTDHLFSNHVHYRPLAALPFAERIARLRDPVVLDDDADMRVAGFVWMLHQQIRAGNLYVLGEPADYEPGPERSLLAIAGREGRPPLEVAYDLMMADDGHGMLYAPLLGYTDRNLDALREMLVHPSTVLGLADGGAHVGVICDGSMPTFMLTHWVRDRSRGERIPLELAVQLQTERPAQLFGFGDRGRLAPGYLADVNVIDFDHLSLGPIRMAYDLPAGGRRLVQHASGYRATVKSGVIVREDDHATGERPGRLLRGPQPLAS